MSHDVALMLRSNGPPSDAFQCRRLDRLHSKRNRFKTGAMQKVDEILIQIVQACLAFKSNRQFFADDVLSNGSAALPFLGEQRIAENDVHAPIAAANFLDFRNNVRRGSRSIRRGNPMWTVCAEFRTA